MKWWAKDILIPVVSILCITGTELFALSQGVNGIALTASIAAVSGLGGFGLGKVWSKFSG